ncbi:hypothetical protein ID866_10395 [Astraeus odoratus]|nr:hypothetical protein ID866_10395 [Astraeus odoratus]
MRRGGCATVYPGTAPDGTKVAIKTYRCGPPERDEDIRSILRELYLWSKLHHKSILPLLGITFKFEHTVSLVSPWMAKGNAHDYVQDKSIDPRPLLVDIADGLLYLHTYSPPIYHGDLKGYNILISDDGRAVLTDFGLSFLVNSSISVARSSPKGGTLNWLAPESVDDLCCITAERDVWAFGMTTLVYSRVGLLLYD